MTKIHVSHKLRSRKSVQKPILMRCKRLCNGLSLTYILRARADRVPTGFLIEVTLGKERSCHSVGTDLTYAISCFRRIVRGGVTPCTLVEILQDMHCEELF